MEMTKDDFEALLDKYLHGQTSPQETKLLDQFFDSYRKPDGAIEEVSEEIKGEILKSIYVSIDRKQKMTAKPVFGIWLRAAAVISFFLVASYFLYSGFIQPEGKVTQQLSAKLKEVHVLRGQKLDIKLSDGSRIRLNANSKLSYPEKFAGEIRKVYLEGEAYFEVAHVASRPFIVQTSHASTQVLGTSFNVLSGHEATEVTLVEGKVNVSTPDGQTAMLTPNLQAKIVRGYERIDTKEVDVDKVIGWKDNTLRFDNISIKDAFNIIENWYDVTIEVKDKSLLNCMITSKYQNESLENVLNSFRFILGIEFTINGQNVLVSGKGCAEK